MLRPCESGVQWIGETWRKLDFPRNPGQTSQAGQSWRGRAKNGYTGQKAVQIWFDSFWSLPPPHFLVFKKSYHNWFMMKMYMLQVYKENTVYFTSYSCSFLQLYNRKTMVVFTYFNTILICKLTAILEKISESLIILDIFREK